MPFQIVQIIYWLTLSTWFGGVLFFAIAAPIIFQTVRDANPVLPHVLSVNLEAAHGNILAGSIIANLLAFFGKIQLFCGGILLATAIGQFFVIDLVDRNLVAAILRLSMIVAAAAIVVFDRLAVRPQLFRYRQEYLDKADEPEIAKAARDNFDREHHRSETLLMATFFLLLGTVLFSANISPAGISLTHPAAQSTPNP
jgi:hypothetical protein